MPGFNIAGAGQGPNSLAEVRRTHRWILESIEKIQDQKVWLVLKTCSRPSMTMEEPAMHHNQEQVYFAGKHTWEPISMSWYDVENEPNVSKAMWDWMQVCIQFTGSGDIPVVAPPSTYKGTVKLNMVDGAGTATEQWGIYNGWPQAINWGGLDYSSTELQLIEVKFRFDRAVKLQ